MCIKKDKEAVANAMVYLRDIQISSLIEVRVEEVVSGKSVVLSYKLDDSPFGCDRIYKFFDINPSSNEVISMKVYNHPS